MIVYYHDLLALISKQILKNHPSRTYMHFMFCRMLQKVNLGVALGLINKSGQDHPLATVKMFYFGQHIPQAGTGNRSVKNLSSFFLFLLSSGDSHWSLYPSTEATFSTSILHEAEDIMHVIGVSLQRGSLLVMQS